MPLEDRSGGQATETDEGGWKDADNDRCASFLARKCQGTRLLCFFLMFPVPTSNERSVTISAFLSQAICVKVHALLSENCLP